MWTQAIICCPCEIIHGILYSGLGRNVLDKQIKLNLEKLKKYDVLQHEYIVLMI